MPRLTPNQDQEVTIIEQGSPKVNEITTIFSGTGSQVGTHTVPLGKKWIVKGFNLYTYGTYTGTDSDIYFSIGGKHFNPPPTLATPLVSNTEVNHLFNQNIILCSGDSLSISVGISANTDGNLRTRVLYMESNQ